MKGSVVVSCPACVCLLTRNGLVNKAEFLGSVAVFVGIVTFFSGLLYLQLSYDLLLWLHPSILFSLKAAQSMEL